MTIDKFEKHGASYEGWKEPKIAVSFLNNSHIYYAVVWALLLTWVFWTKFN